MVLNKLDTVVVGAGPAGIGTALALQAVDGLSFGVVERGRIGQTFLDWPAAQTFLTPSFTGNGFGATDLNAVHPETSPAYSLGVDYPTGKEYVRYLRNVAAHFRLPVMDEAGVTAVELHDDGFVVHTARGSLTARTVVWAGGEFHEPRPPRSSGSGLVDHTASPVAWTERRGEVLVIGGYESGIDVACHHVEADSTVVVCDRGEPWGGGPGSDPSFRLAPRSRIRLRAAQRTGRLRLVAANVGGVKRDGDGFVASLDDGTKVRSDSRPIAATGYGPGLGPVAELFAAGHDGWPILDEDDQSTTTPGLFLSGPAIRHRGQKFCFVYKFRQRHAHVAKVIGERLGNDTVALEAWRAAGMLTDDLSCCGVECAC